MLTTEEVIRLFCAWWGSCLVQCGKAFQGSAAIHPTVYTRLSVKNPRTRTTPNRLNPFLWVEILTKVSLMRRKLLTRGGDQAVLCFQRQLLSAVWDKQCKSAQYSIV